MFDFEKTDPYDFMTLWFCGLGSHLTTGYSLLKDL